MTIIYQVQYGSRLYGTSTPKSDVDIKRIVLPNIRDMLVGKDLKNKCYKTNNQYGVRNTENDVDIEEINLQTLAWDYIKGQTYAVEILSSMQFNHSGQQFHPAFIKPLGEFYKLMKMNYTTRTMRDMVGYAMNQARIYGMKGARYDAGKIVYNLLHEAETFMSKNGWKAATLQQAIGVVPNGKERLEDVIRKYPTYVSWTTIEATPSQAARPAVKVLGSRFALNDTAIQVRNGIKARLDKYGQRAIDSGPEAADWKALMHALRIAHEGQELLKNRCIEFPHAPDKIALYLDIRQGKVPMNILQDMITHEIDTLLEMEAASTLPEYSIELREALDDSLAEMLYSDFYRVTHDADSSSQNR